MVVLALTGDEMRLRDIHARVEQVLAGSVSFESVADYVRRRSKGPQPLFEHTGHGHYRLLRRRQFSARVLPTGWLLLDRSIQVQ